MKGFFVVVAVIAAAVLIIAVPRASASETSWRVEWKADNGAGQISGPQHQTGVYPASVDGLDSVFNGDHVAPYLIDSGQTLRWVTGIIPGESSTFDRDIKSPAAPQSYPGNVKQWEIRVAAMPMANDDPICLSVAASFSSGLPPQSISGKPMGFRLIMVDNKGMTGAPANGRTWSIPVPTVATGPYPDFFWKLPQDELLPMLKLSAPNHAAMIGEGYQMRFEQYVVPEPTSLIALGSGLIGLAGLGLRRRRC